MVTEIAFEIFGVLMVYTVGFVTGCALGFVWRPVYDAWFRLMWLRLTRRFR